MKINLKDDSLYLTPEIDLIASTIEALRDEIVSELKANHNATMIILDATGIDQVDSLGVNLIIGLFRQIKSESKTFEIINAGEKFMKVAVFFKFSSLFTIRAEGEEA